jgi:hypothetical protein
MTIETTRANLTLSAHLPRGGNRNETTAEAKRAKRTYDDFILLGTCPSGH